LIARYVKAAAGFFTAKQAPRRPGTAPALGLRADCVAAPTVEQTTIATETPICSRSLFESFGRRSTGRLRKRARAITGRPRPAKRRLVLEELDCRALLSTVFTAVAAGDPTSDGAIL